MAQNPKAPPSDKRNEQVSRVLRILQHLELKPQGLTIKQIHSKIQNDGYKVSERTIYRDLEAIERAHFPITTEKIEIDGASTSLFKLNKFVEVAAKVSFSYQEILALFFAKESMRAFEGSPIYSVLLSLFTKIEKLLGKKAQIELEELLHISKFRPKSQWQVGVSQETLDTLYNACLEGQVIQLLYKSVSGPQKGQYTPRTLGPEKLYFADNGAYLIAKDLKTGILKTYALSRMKDVEMTDEPYESKEVDLNTYFKGALGVYSEGSLEKVCIHITEPIASYVAERRWHESQSLIRRSNGVELKLEIKINEELARWILSLGPNAYVIEPQSLQEIVKSMAEKISESYTQKAA